MLDFSWRCKPLYLNKAIHDDELRRQHALLPIESLILLLLILGSTIALNKSRRVKIEVIKEYIA